MDLPEIYRSIANKALHANPWPNSSGFLKYLDQNKEGVYVVPKFPKGEGPVGVFAMTSRNDRPGNSKVVSTCLEMFDSFCEDLRAIFPDGLEEDFVIVKSLAPHITVSIFQEHPRLLQHSEDSRMQEDFYFIDDEKTSALAESLASRTSPFEPIDLMLDSVLFTIDGAMIAGFVDNSSNGSFGRLKGEISDDANNILQGKVTSRPKSLIHMTCGRIVSINSHRQDSERHLAIKRLVERYNQRVLPKIVAQLNDPVFRLEEVALLRNDVWLCEQNTEYGVGKLDGGAETRNQDESS
jgi:hypothetical protein